MIPQIFQLGPFPINSFGLCVALAFIAGSLRLRLSFRRLGLNESLAEPFVFLAGIVGLIGARLWYLFENWDDVKLDLGSAVLSSAGFTFYGGFIFSTLAIIWYCRKNQVAVSDFAGAVGPCLTLAYAIGRLGCQLSGDGDYGDMTTTIWGMSYGTGVVPTPPGFLAYPTPLYESTLCLLALLWLSKVERLPNWAPVERFGLYLVLVSSERFIVEFLRINPRFFLGLSQAQIISVMLVLIGSYLLSGRLRKSR